MERDFQELAVEQIHQACAYGSNDQNGQNWWPIFLTLSALTKYALAIISMNHGAFICRGPKRVFATALEVHYPAQLFQLCDALAETIALALQKQGVTPTAHLSLNQTARAFTNLQARTSKVPTFLPEYKNRIVTL